MATRRWLGTAQNIAQVDTITAALTWATGDTASITIGAVTITVTVGTAAATTNVVAAMTAAVNGAALVGDETRNTTGDLHPEFSWITASTSGSTCILTADVAGRPFTAAVASVTAGTGTWVLANTTAATGKNYWTNADNWSGGAVPINNDVIVFDTGSVSCLYGIDQSATVHTGSQLRIEAGYTGQIGLAEINSDIVGSTYSEYNDKYLASDWATVVIGEGQGNGSGLLRIDCDGASTSVYVYGTATSTETGSSALIVTNINGGTVYGYQGDIAVDPIRAQTSADVDIEVGYDTSLAGDVSVYVGFNADLGSLTCYGGSVELWTGCDTLNIKAGTVRCSSGPTTTVTVEGGTIEFTAAAITTLLLAGSGTADFTRCLSAATVTNPVDMYGSNCTLTDTTRAISTLVVDCNYGATAAQVNRGGNNRLTYGTPA